MDSQTIKSSSLEPHEDNVQLKQKIYEMSKQIKELIQESKGLQYENEILQKSLKKNNNDDQIQQLQSMHQREKEYWIRDQQEQINRIKNVQDQTKRLLQEKLDHVLKEKEFLKIELENNKTVLENYEFQIDQIQENYQAEIASLQKELKQKQCCIEELKHQLQEQETYTQRNNNSELLNKLKEAIDELNKCKKIITNQQQEIQMQCRLFDELKVDYQKKLCKERSKSQLSLKVAQEVKTEFEKKYCNLMEQIIRNQQSKSCNNSFKILPSSIDQTMNNDVSRISNNQSKNIGLSAINKALSDSIDDYEKSILNNISGNGMINQCDSLQTKRKGTRSEWDSKNKQLKQKDLMISITPENLSRPNSSLQQQEMLSPKISQRRNQSIHSSKCVKQYTFNLCEEGRVSNDAGYYSSQGTQATRQSKTTITLQKSFETKRASRTKKHSKENAQITIPEENQKINNIHSSKQFQALEDKNERLDTNLRFNSLLKIL